jgi:hypothetical protein
MTSNSLSSAWRITSIEGTSFHNLVEQFRYASNPARRHAQAVLAGGCISMGYESETANFNQRLSQKCASESSVASATVWANVRLASWSQRAGTQRNNSILLSSALPRRSLTEAGGGEGEGGEKARKRWWFHVRAASAGHGRVLECIPRGFCLPGPLSSCKRWAGSHGKK